MARKLSADDWAEYLALYNELSERLAREPWFAEGWETRFDYFVGRAGQSSDDDR